MKHFGIAIIIFALFAVSGCGSSSSNSSINGNWSATLTSADGTQALAFTATLAWRGGVVTVSNLSFSTSSACIALGTTATVALPATGTSGCVTTGTFQMTIQTGSGNTNGTNRLALLLSFNDKATT